MGLEQYMFRVQASGRDSEVAEAGVIAADADHANLAHIRQSRPHSDLGVQVKALKIIYVTPSSLGCGPRNRRGRTDGDRPKVRYLNRMNLPMSLRCRL